MADIDFWQRVVARSRREQIMTEHIRKVTGVTYAITYDMYDELYKLRIQKEIQKCNPEPEGD